MPSTLTSRAVLRQSRLLLRRNNVRPASTTSEAAAKAKETASGTVSKASEGLTRVTSSAGNIVTGAASGVRNIVTKIGGRTGKLIGIVDSLIPPTVYYARVGLELSKLIFQAQKMSPPSLAQFQSYLQPIVNAVQAPKTLLSTASTSSVTPGTVLRSIRNMNRQQLVSSGVVAAEVLGFFTVGTMIGRMKVVGYHGEPSHGH